MTYREYVKSMFGLAITEQDKEDDSYYNLKYLENEYGSVKITMSCNYLQYGHTKMPRKMKKRLFKSKKDRLKYLPEYYGRQ